MRSSTWLGVVTVAGVIPNATSTTCCIVESRAMRKAAICSVTGYVRSWFNSAKSFHRFLQERSSEILIHSRWIEPPPWMWNRMPSNATGTTTNAAAAGTTTTATSATAASPTSATTRAAANSSTSATTGCEKSLKLRRQGRQLGCNGRLALFYGVDASVISRNGGRRRIGRSQRISCRCHADRGRIAGGII
ncbi:hypothetical protein OUZ56_017976 [Daphnia magna]|uniref:Secreted protein n=1 Tax=Daphnia magna TaxID=35525 RepID=A0ABR0ATT2_9CRUS|nr:hypothetical protein OUZ56_017976 [Daphnia magna]